MKQGRPSVTRASPRTPDVGDFVVDPGEATTSGSCDQRRRLPVQDNDRIFQWCFGRSATCKRRKPSIGAITLLICELDLTGEATPSASAMTTS